MHKLIKVDKTPHTPGDGAPQPSTSKQPTTEEQPANNAQADKGKQDAIPRDSAPVHLTNLPRRSSQLTMHKLTKVSKTPSLETALQYT